MNFSTIVLGFKPRPFLYRMDLNYDESHKGSLRALSLAVFVADFLMIVSGFKPRPFLYRIDLINDESRKGSLRVHSLAMFITYLSTIVSGVVAPRHHLMMDLKSTKPIRKPLGHYPRPRQIVEFNLNALDGRSMLPSWFEPKPMTATEHDLSIATNQHSPMA